MIKKIKEFIKKNHPKILILTGFAIAIFSFIYFLPKYLGIKVPMTFEDFIAELGFIVLTLLIGLILLIIGLMNHIVKRDETIAKIDNFFMFIALSLFGGFIVFVLIIYLKPNQFIAEPIPVGWWSALAIMNTALFATLAIIYNYRKEILEKTIKMDEFKQNLKTMKDNTNTKFRSVESTDNEQNKRVESIKADFTTLSKKYDQLLTSNNKILTLLTESYKVEMGTLEENLDNILSTELNDSTITEMANLEPKVREQYTSGFINLTSLIWQKLPTFMSNSEEYQKIAQLITKIRERLCNISPEDIQLKLYYAYALIELEIDIETKNLEKANKIIESIKKPEVKPVENSDADRTKYENELDQYKYAESLKVKLLMREDNYSAANEFAKEAKKNFPNSIWDKKNYLLCNLISQEPTNECRQFLADEIKKVKNYDNEGYRTFLDMMNLFCNNNDENKKRFYDNFFVINTPFFSRITAYERFSFFNCYKNLKKFLNKELLDIYLIYYRFWGDSDIEANKVLTNEKIRELELMMMKNMYEGILVKNN